MNIEKAAEAAFESAHPDKTWASQNSSTQGRWLQGIKAAFNVAGVGVIEEVYWAVPDHYTIGEIFPAGNEGHAAAIAFAKAKIKPIDYRTLKRSEKEGGDFDWTRASLDKRFKVSWTDPIRAGQSHVEGGIDTSVERREVFLLESEKKAKLEEAGFVPKASLTAKISINGFSQMEHARVFEVQGEYEEIARQYGAVKDSLWSDDHDVLTLVCEFESDETHDANNLLEVTLDEIKTYVGFPAIKVEVVK